MHGRLMRIEAALIVCLRRAFAAIERNLLGVNAFDVCFQLLYNRRQCIRMATDHCAVP